jgi:hypothetical protein
MTGAGFNKLLCSKRQYYSWFYIRKTDSVKYCIESGMTAWLEVLLKLKTEHLFALTVVSDERCNIFMMACQNLIAPQPEFSGAAEWKTEFCFEISCFYLSIHQSLPDVTVGYLCPLPVLQLCSEASQFLHWHQASGTRKATSQILLQAPKLLSYCSANKLCKESQDRRCDNKSKVTDRSRIKGKNKKMKRIKEMKERHQQKEQTEISKYKRK